MMPAMRATPSTSPFFALPRLDQRERRLAHDDPAFATAIRSVAGFSETSTMRASPRASIWVRAGPLLEDFAPSARACRADGFASRQQCAGGRRDVGLPHQAFADQEGRHADALRAARDRPARRCRSRRPSGGPCGISGASASLVASVVSKVRRLRLLTPIIGERSLSARSSSARVVDLDQHVHAEGDARILDIARPRRRRARP